MVTDQNMSFRRRQFSPSRIVTLVTLLGMFLLSGISIGHTKPSLIDSPTNKLPVNFSSKTLSHDEEKQTVTATGDVELVQGERILRADKIVYYLAEDRVSAIGNVSLLDETGDVHFAESVELHNNMKDGFVKELLSLLADGSRFTAAEAKRENGGMKTSMKDATYTVCKVCEADPDPLWQIKASSVTHDAETKTIKYKNARMELLGVPLLYSPIFSHPDPTLKRKSGFLRPQYGWTTELGSHLTAGYYFDIAPDKDMTVQVQPTSLAGTLFEGEWRERFRHGRLQINASTANSDRKEEDGRVETNLQRGHIFAEGRYDINELWRGGLNIARASDKEYLRLYDISKEDVLSNQIYAERFSGRDYSRISALSFQDVRLGVRPDQPDIFPMMEHTMTAEPNSLFGGRIQLNGSALSLVRDGDDQDVQRASLRAGWEKRGVSSFGLANVLKLEGRGDFYDVQHSDAEDLDPTLDSDPTTGRGNVTASLVSSYPLVKRLSEAQAVIKPVAGVSLSPEISQDDEDIPNEDSIDVQFDSSNLFEQNRFPGIDRLEDGGRLNYGLESGIYGDQGRYGKIFAGQSYRFYGDGIFPEGSGLEDRHSDYVGQIKLGLSKYLDADYRFQFDHETLDAKRHEVQAGGGNDTFRLNGRYLYIAPVAGVGFLEPREQVHFDGTYNFNKNWKFDGLWIYDLGDEPGLRNATAGIGYADECFTFSLQGARNVAEEASGDNETRLMIRIGFKSIGEFAGPQIPLGGQQVKQPK